MSWQQRFRAIARINSVLAQAMADSSVGVSPAVAASRAEKGCALWAAGKNQVELKIAHKDGHSERKLFTTTPLGHANHMKCIFKRIQDFSQKA